MYTDRKILEEILQSFKYNQKIYKEELEKLPDGTLNFTESNGRKQYFQVTRDGSRNKRVSIGSRPQIINQLARKEFLRRTLIELDENIRVLKYAINHYRDINPSTIIDSMTRAYKRLPKELFFCPTEPLFISEDEDVRMRLERHREWAEMEYERNTYPFGPYSQYTTRGLHVRSNRELVISEILYRFKVPFRYDQIIHSGNNKLSPDFSFEMADYRELYLEYWGMMDDPQYVANFLRKRKLYEQAGIFEWDNIIYVFSKDKQMNTQQIEDIIKNLIIPRL